jgi:hypothetical protein
MTSAAAQEKTSNGPGSPEKECRQALDHVEQALEAAPAEVIANVREAESAVVRLRDQAIVQLRSDPASTQARQLRARLDQLNVALSCLAGVEYPSGGIHHKLLKQARKVLQQLVGELPK